MIRGRQAEEQRETPTCRQSPSHDAGGHCAIGEEDEQKKKEQNNRIEMNMVDMKMDDGSKQTNKQNTEMFNQTNREHITNMEEIGGNNEMTVD